MIFIFLIKVGKMSSNCSVLPHALRSDILCHTCPKFSLFSHPIDSYDFIFSPFLPLPFSPLLSLPLTPCLVTQQMLADCFLPILSWGTRSGASKHSCAHESPAILLNCRIRFSRSRAEPEILHFQHTPRRFGPPFKEQECKGMG